MASEMERHDRPLDAASPPRGSGRAWPAAVAACSAVLLAGGWSPPGSSRESAPQVQIDQALPPLPQGITSFGAAVLDEQLFVVGGHLGRAHHYSREEQSDRFLRLPLDPPGEWQTLAPVPRRTGTALVAHKGKLIAVGGFEARNKDEEDENLWSMPDVAEYDPAAGKWEALTPLPEGRSSHDAAVIGSTLYVVGGWTMTGPDPKKWLTSAWKADLAVRPLVWKPLAEAPFQRRAVSAAEWKGKLLVVGGMRPEGGPTTETAIYDPAADAWSAGPAIEGKPMDGFGSSTCTVDGRVICTTYSGRIQRLADDGTRWETLGMLQHPRFFHRAVASEGCLLVVGGAHMGTGKITATERFRIAAKNPNP